MDLSGIVFSYAPTCQDLSFVTSAVAYVLVHQVPKVARLNVFDLFLALAKSMFTLSLSLSLSASLSSFFF